MFESCVLRTDLSSGKRQTKHAVQLVPASVGKTSSRSDTPRSMFPALPVNMRPVLLLSVASRMEPKRSITWGMLVNILWERNGVIRMSRELFCLESVSMYCCWRVCGCAYHQSAAASGPRKHCSSAASTRDGRGLSVCGQEVQTVYGTGGTLCCAPHSSCVFHVFHMNSCSMQMIPSTVAMSIGTAISRARIRRKSMPMDSSV